MGILCLWVICSFGAGLGIWYQINIRKQASTVVRKYFHVLAVIVFTSGVIRDTTLLYLSSGGVLAVFIVLEVKIVQLKIISIQMQLYNENIF